MDTVEMIGEFETLFEKKGYLSKLKNSGEKGLAGPIGYFVEIDFKDIIGWNCDLADCLLDNPEEAIKSAQIAFGKLNEQYENIQVLFYNLPDSTVIPLNEISLQLEKFLTFEGYIMKPSDIFLKCIAARFECPSCFPKGTLVLTPNGYAPIESVTEVMCLDHNFNLIKQSALVKNNGEKKTFLINGYVNGIKHLIVCSSDHKWFVYRNGITKVIQTKALNTGDILYKLNEDMPYLQKDTQSTQKNLFRKMQEKVLQYFSTRRGKNKNKQQEDNLSVYKRGLVDPDSYQIGNKSQINQKETSKIQNPTPICKRTVQNQFEKKGIKAWQKMWRKRISQISKEIPPVALYQMREDKRKQSKKGFISPPHQFESLRQQAGKFDGSLSITPFTITSVDKTSRSTEMYDLIIPRYNNFVIFPEIVTHNCGNLINVIMLGRDWKEPSRCGCGRKGKFRLLKKTLTKFQRMEIQEVLNTVPDKPRRLIKKKVYIANALVRPELNKQLQPGQHVRIYGFLETEEMRIKGARTASNEFKVNIVANNIIPVETSWDSIVISPKQKTELQEMASSHPDLLEEFANSLAPSFEGYVMMRKSLILQHVGGKRIYDENKNLEERGIIHVLMSGKPGSGKSYAAKKSTVISPLWHWSQGSGLTKAGLVACITRDEYGSFTLEVGPLVMANNGLCLIDEIEKMNKDDFGMLNNAMNDEQTKITKANIDQTLQTRTSVLATSNPTHKVFVPSGGSIMGQLAPIPRDILDRFDVIWAMRENIDQNKLEEKYMARHLNKESIKQNWSNEEMRFYIAYARRLTPSVSKEIAEYFKQKFMALTGKTKTPEEGGESETSNRMRGNIMRWVYAHSKFIGVGKEDKHNQIEVTKESVNFAFSLMRCSYEMLDLISEEGFVKYENMEEIPTKQEINKYYLVKDTLKSLSKDFNNCIPEYEIMKLIQKQDPAFNQDNFEAEVAKLKKYGEAFEPRRGYWGVL